MDDSVRKYLGTILEQNDDLLQNVNWPAVENFSQRLKKARRLFFAAQGRSGFILKTFCVRMIHLGLECYFAGETVCPPIKKRDLLITLSGSGETCLTCETAKLAKAAGAEVWAVLGEENSRLADISDNFVLIPGGAKNKPEAPESQPLGSLFEQSAFLLLESLAYSIYRQSSLAGTLMKYHSNLE